MAYLAALSLAGSATCFLWVMASMVRSIRTKKHTRWMRDRPIRRSDWTE